MRGRKIIRMLKKLILVVPAQTMRLIDTVLGWTIWAIAIVATILFFGLPIYCRIIGW